MNEPEARAREGQSAGNPTRWPAAARELHGLYCQWTAQPLSLRFDRERLWYEFLRAGFSAADLKQVVSYLQKEIRARAPQRRRAQTVQPAAIGPLRGRPPHQPRAAQAPRPTPGTGASASPLASDRRGATHPAARGTADLSSATPLRRGRLVSRCPAPFRRQSVPRS
jgi:hypothetical protein